jgi:hypothetical protein
MVQAEAERGDEVGMSWNLVEKEAKKSADGGLRKMTRGRFDNADPSVGSMFGFLCSVNFASRTLKSKIL